MIGMKAAAFKLSPGEDLPDDLGSWDSERTLALVFGPSRPSPGEAVARIRAALPRAALLGCSTAGEIFGAEVLDGSIVLGLMRFREVNLRVMSAPIESGQPSHDAGRAIAQSLESPDLRAVFVLSDGLKVNGSRLVQGLTAALPPDVVITGGLAGDGDQFLETWVIADSAPTSGQVTAVGLYGRSLVVGHGSRGGWDIFGVERKVTRSTANVLYELDGRPALALYQEYLGDLAAELPSSALLFPLLLKAGPGDTEGVARTVLAVSEADQSMTFAGDLPEGSTVQFMRANFERVITGASDAATLAGRGHPEGEPLVLLAISCVGRRLVLKERCEEELEAALETLPRGTMQVGFYSYGEISPHAGGDCQLHNQTMTLTALSETACRQRGGGDREKPRARWNSTPPSPVSCVGRGRARTSRPGIRRCGCRSCEPLPPPIRPPTGTATSMSDRSKSPPANCGKCTIASTRTP